MATNNDFGYLSAPVPGDYHLVFTRAEAHGWLGSDRPGSHGLAPGLGLRQPSSRVPVSQLCGTSPTPRRTHDIPQASRSTEMLKFSFQLTQPSPPITPLLRFFSPR